MTIEKIYMHKYLNQKTTNNIAAGIVSGLIIIIIAIACAALIFKGSLQAYFPIGVSCAIISSCIVNLIIAKFSSFKFSIARIEPVVAAILAIISANIVNSQIADAAILPTVLATFFLLSIITGITMFLLGYFRLGQIIRFLPYPVLCGIISGTAWIMTQSSLTLMSHGYAQYIVGIGFTIWLILTRIWKIRAWIIPFSLIVLAIAINLFLHEQHISHISAIQNDWLFSPFKADSFLHGMHFSMIQHIAWNSILQEMNYIGSIVGIIIIILLFNISGLESLYKIKSDAEHELKITGAANFLCAFGLGIPANMSFSGTTLNKNSGANHRLSGIVASVVCLCVLFGYPSIITYIPKPLIGGLLLFISFKLIFDWLFEGWKKLPIADYIVVLLILLTVAIWGFLYGIAIGILITCFLFIIRYTRIDAIKFSTTGESYRSNVVRPYHQQKWLAKHGKTIHVFKLQGYLFFGSAKLLLDKINALLQKDIHQEIRFLIFDFHLVNGVDPSASMSFIRLQHLTHHLPLQLVFCHCTPTLIQQFRQQEVFAHYANIMIFNDLDQGMEWCEEQLLRDMPQEFLPSAIVIPNVLDQLIPKEVEREIFITYLEKLSIPAHSILLKQGELIDDLYFIESGEVSIHIAHNHTSIRLAKSGPGTIVGEIAFFLRTPRTATVTTITHCVVYKLTQKALKSLEEAHPQIALMLQKSIIHVLALRVMQTNYELTLLANA